MLIENKTDSIINFVNKQAKSPWLVRMRCFRIAGMAVFDTLFTLIGGIVLFFILNKYFPNYVFSVHHAIAIIFSMFLLGIVSHGIFLVDSKLNSYISNAMHNLADFIYNPNKVF